MTPSVFRDLASAEGSFGPCALAIGNFDGVHAGHTALLQQTAAYARENGFVPSVLTFHPHPSSVLAPERQPEMICSLEDRIRLLSAAGARRILVLPFTPELARLAPREFVSQYLVNSLQSKAVFVGENFRFGHKQSGTSDTLRALGVEFGFDSQFLPPVVIRRQVVSSSVIRRYISLGHISKANRLLRRCFALSGPIVPGHGIGSKQTVPTLNLQPVPGLACPRGVFVTETVDSHSGRRWPSITNVGMRPTFGGDKLTIETYLLAPLEGPPPAHIDVAFRRFLRPEREFPTPQALKSQILHDVVRAQAYWHRISRLSGSIASIY